MNPWVSLVYVFGRQSNVHLGPQACVPLCVYRLNTEDPYEGFTLFPSVFAAAAAFFLSYNVNDERANKHEPAWHGFHHRFNFDIWHFTHALTDFCVVWTKPHITVCGLVAKCFPCCSFYRNYIWLHLRDRWGMVFIQMSWINVSNTDNHVFIYSKKNVETQIKRKWWQLINTC